MAKKKTVQRSDADAAGQQLADRGVKGIVELTKIALKEAPAAQKAIVYAAGIGALLCIIVAVLFIAKAQYDHGLKTFWGGMGLLGVTIIGVLAVILRAKNKDEAPASGAKQSGPSGPIWSHFRETIEKCGGTDLLIHLFCCPDPSPTEISKLTEYSVHSLWADVRGGSIKVQLIESEPRHLDIEFFNCDEGWPSSVTIRPGGLKPYKRARDQSFLCLDVRIPAPVPEGELKKISLCFRIVDRLGTHWFHSRGEDDFLIERVEVTDDAAQWKSIRISLTDGHWKVFKADGNHCYPKTHPDFEEFILALVVDFGKVTGNSRPGGPAKGRILLRNIHFSDQ